MEALRNITTKYLDISLLKTVEDINNICFEDYSDEEGWVKYVTPSVAVEDLIRICHLSNDPKCQYDLAWHMGDLYYHRKGVPLEDR